MLIGSYVHSAVDGDFDTGFRIRQTTSEKADFSEVRLLQGWKRLNATAGVGHYDGRGVLSQQFGAIQFPESEMNARHTNGYLYTDVGIASDLAIFAGVSYDTF